MVTTTPLRVLRMKHRVTLSELAQAAGVSAQQINRLELGEIAGTGYQEEKIAIAWANLIAHRKEALVRLEVECLCQRGSFLKKMEVERDEQ